MSDSMCEKVKDIVLNGYLECPVCLEFVVGPIYNCNNGHIVCGICKEKTVKCPTCQTRTLTMNPLLERILRSEEITLPCRYNQQGCTNKIKPHLMKLHLNSYCDFTPIKCNKTTEVFDQSMFSPDDMFKHWVETHKLAALFPLIEKNDETPKCKLLKFLGLPEVQYNNAISSANTPVRWGSHYFEFDNNTFFIHVLTKEENIHSWITMLGHETDANKYYYSTILSSEYSNSKTKNIIFNEIPVHCLQLYDINKVEALGHTASVSYNAMKLLHDKKPVDPTRVFDWKVELIISKLEGFKPLDLLTFEKIPS